MSSITKINGHKSPPHPCPHLAAFRSKHGGAKPFRALQDCLRVRPPGGRASIHRDPDELPRCAACFRFRSSSRRLYACVTCAAVHCHAPPPHSSHAADHAVSGHEIAVDVDRAELFCCACKDQVYDRDFDAAVVLAQTATSSAAASSSAMQSYAPENLRKRRRIDYKPWSPDWHEQVIVGKNSTLLHGGGSHSDLPWGLRGLNNLGNTCFMNSVLQALLHTPPLRSYFLSDKHNRYYCQKMRSDAAAAEKKTAGKNGGKAVCLACDTDETFSAVFSGDQRPYSPAKFLYSWWQYAANLASYEQQDAHEFFISMLDGIHEKVEKEGRKTGSEGYGFRYLAFALGVVKCSQFRAYIHPLPAGLKELFASLQFRV